MTEEAETGAVSGADDDRLRIVYELACEHDQDAFARAREIAFEQTVELPEACVPAALQRAVVARLEGMERLDKRRWRATLSYAAEIVGGEVPQLLNVLFGNVSLLDGVRVVDVGWPRSLLEALPGPAFGIDGVRRLLPQADGRALLCTALKPIGLTSRELATLAGRFARGGVDLIKDDHGLADQGTAPFAERVARCQHEVRGAAEETGAESLYLPHLTGPVDELPARFELLRREGVRGALVSPFVLGLDVLRWLAKTSGLVLLRAPDVVGDALRSSPRHRAGGRLRRPAAAARRRRRHLRQLRRPLPGRGRDLRGDQRAAAPPARRRATGVSGGRRRGEGREPAALGGALRPRHHLPRRRQPLPAGGPRAGVAAAHPGPGLAGQPIAPYWVNPRGLAAAEAQALGGGAANTCLVLRKTLRGSHCRLSAASRARLPPYAARTRSSPSSSVRKLT